MFYNSFTTDLQNKIKEKTKTICESVAGLSFQSFLPIFKTLTYKNGLKSYFQSQLIFNIAKKKKQKIIIYVSR